MYRTLSLFIFACLLVLHVQAATVQFGPRQDIATNFQHLTGLAVADFNGDGYPDIAVTDDYANQVTVYLNDGHGGFGKPIVNNLTTTGYAGLGYLVSGDVNEDGKQDLIVAPIGGLQYDIVLLGNGDGTFTQGQVLKSTYGFLNAQLVDINGDKHLDLVSGANGTNFVELGDGKGNFVDSPLPTDRTTIYFNTGLAVADFNKDGHPDLLLSSYNSFNLEFFAGNGDGTFQSPVKLTPNYLGTSGASLSAADFNGDGNPDILLGENDADIIVFGNGDGTFKLDESETASPYLPQPSPLPNSTVAPLLATADIDNDGKSDVVAADDNSALLSVFLNDGTGKFTQASPDFSASIVPGNGQIRLADLNGDGLPDIVITNYKTQTISVFLSVIPKTTPIVSVSSSATEVLVGSNVTVSVQVKPSGSHVPTGTVSLASNATSFGQQTLDATGNASFALTSLTAGQYPLTATYSGDTYNLNASNTTTLTEFVTDFQLSLPSSTQSVASGSSAVYSLALTPVAGFKGSVTLTCSGLPSAYTCTPMSTAVAGQALTASLVVAPAPTTAMLPRSESGNPPKTTFAVLGLASLCLCFRRSRRYTLLAATLVVASAFPITGCSSASPSKPAYTGTSNFVITATATQGATSVSHQVNATLTVH